MTPPTIPDLINAGALFACEPAAAAEEINRLHRERMAEVVAERDMLKVKLHEYLSECDRLENAAAELAASRAEIERLKLDVGILNGRLIERTETMLARQGESLDEARSWQRVAKRLAIRLNIWFNSCGNKARVGDAEALADYEVLSNRSSTNCGQSADKSTPTAPQ